MTRPTNEQVDAALVDCETWGPQSGGVSGKQSVVLAAEVRALRESVEAHIAMRVKQVKENDKLREELEALNACATRDINALAQVSAARDELLSQLEAERAKSALLAASLKKVDAKIQRVEELLPAWRTEAANLPDSDTAFCISDLDSALRGEP